MNCNRCDTEKRDIDFYKNDRTCKQCRCFLVRKNRAEKADYYREFDVKRSMLPHRVEARKLYAKTDAGKRAAKKSRKKWLKNNSTKRAANVILCNAVRDGRVEKQYMCSECGADDTRIHGHHDDYAYPLNVRWLCALCHMAWHKEHGEALNG